MVMAYGSPRSSRRDDARRLTSPEASTSILSGSPLPNNSTRDNMDTGTVALGVILFY